MNEVLNTSTEAKINQVKAEVEKLLGDEATGHGVDHVLRVYDLAMGLAEAEGADPEIVALAALLHDVDDHKIFGRESAENLTNAQAIMAKADIDATERETISMIIKNMGYNKFLDGIRPTALEGKVVSDADMCDGMGAVGIIRVHEFGAASGRKFFDPEVLPIEDIDSEQYFKVGSSTTIGHYFEKLLRLKGLMLTDAGRKEAETRHQIMVDFLREFFREENQPAWSEYLERYLANLEGVK
ncbi:MAG: HD domain-containing protein [Candidatus Nomurabacteria bacterium]|jgi:uncharacterized protein|nr:HD domain-containing protein [Candidatus Nomurabacteria bacterium]